MDSSAAEQQNPLMNNAYHHHGDDDEEEECRVCRGPAEEGHPLFKPCKCSGSIGLTHQDCLQSWLQVQRLGDGRCELCKTKFSFAPRYSPGAPERLPIAQVLSGLLRCALAKWLPFCLRSAFCASLWLIVAPLMTDYLYQGWMHRPGAIMDRLQWALVSRDIVSGAVVAAIIIISFLSLMSFADFLRVEWQQHGLIRGAGGGGQENNRQHHHRLGHGPEEPALQPTDADIDNELWIQSQQEILAARNNTLGTAGHAGVMRWNGSLRDNIDSNNAFGSLDHELHDMDDDDDDDADSHDDEDDSDDDDDAEDLMDDEDSIDSWDGGDGMMEDILDNDDDHDGAQLQHVIDMERRIRENLGGLQDPRNDAPLDRNAVVDAPPPEEPIDMDINIALDELLGVRGPIAAVLRNLLWLLAFNTVYLGFFAFTPRVVGMSITSIFFNTTRLFASITDNSTESSLHLSANSSAVDVLRAVEVESERQQTTFRLSDLASVMIGYLACACFVLFMKTLWILSKRFRLIRTGRARTANAEEVRDALDEINRIMLGGNINDMNLGDDQGGIAVSYAVDVALDATTAIVKIGVLLLLKMFLLPIALGLCLDAVTMSVFGNSMEDRVLYAGKDLFSFILLHWIAGITFMLLVTVSVLQLREVAHPDLLAQIIRPQEPQPDLLGNLLHESVGTHAKRMVLSLIIYAALLALHVHIPIRMIISAGSATNMPLLQLKTWYMIMPQLQVPLELLVFHLCMLGLLERNKNSIGEMQHHWLKFIGLRFGMIDCMLPRTISEFALVGSRPVYKGESGEIDSFWYDLANNAKSGEAMIKANIKTFKYNYVGEIKNAGETKLNGDRVLRFGSDYIRLPVRLPGRALRSRSVLLATKIGRYRLIRDTIATENPVIEVWEEVLGDLIPRPPEGWDDLGAGGADVQGRWAWGREKRSTIERGVAQRDPLFDGKQSPAKAFGNCCKIVALLVLSWMMMSILLCLIFVCPLVIGRFLYHIFRVPDKWIHDPFGFAMGSGLFFPFLRSMLKAIVSEDGTLLERFGAWSSRFHPPPMHKIMVIVTAAGLWLGLAPFLAGFLVDLAFIKSTGWFIGEEPWVDKRSVIMDWLCGIVLLHQWTGLCVEGFLTKRFWRNAIDGAARNEDENQADAQAAAWLNAGDNRLRLAWQGKHGRVGRFVDVWKSICFDFEWDKVDSGILLNDCAVPVTTMLLWTLAFPLAVLGFSFRRHSYLTGLARVVCVRGALLVACLIQTARAWQEHVLTWFDAAHKAARDDRYLIGEVLLNYEE